MSRKGIHRGFSRRRKMGSKKRKAMKDNRTK
jgi:hypothetical protein